MYIYLSGPITYCTRGSRLNPIHHIIWIAFALPEICRFQVLPGYGEAQLLSSHEWDLNMQPSYALIEQLICLHLASSNQCTIMNHYILRLWSSFALSSLASNPIYKSTSLPIPWDPMHQSGLLKFSHYGLHLQVQPNLRMITQNRIAQVIHICCINLASRQVAPCQHCPSSSTKKPLWHLQTLPHR